MSPTGRLGAPGAAERSPFPGTDTLSHPVGGAGWRVRALAARLVSSAHQRKQPKSKGTLKLTSHVYSKLIKQKRSAPGTFNDENEKNMC